MIPGWYTIGVRLVYDWYTVVYGDVWWYTAVYGGIRGYVCTVYDGIRRYTAVYGAMCVRYTIGIRWYTVHLWVWYTIGIRLVYDWYTIGIRMLYFTCHIGRFIDENC